MDEELRDKVDCAVEAWIRAKPIGHYIPDLTDAILALFASVLVREQREAFCAGYRATCPDCAEAEAARRYREEEK